MSGGTIYLVGLDDAKKRAIRQNMNDWEAHTGLPFFDMTKIAETLQHQAENGVSGIYDLFNSIDIRAHLSVDPHPSQKMFPCYFLPYHNGWFFDGGGKNRYYTRSMSKRNVVETTLTLDLIDLFQILWDVKKKEDLYAMLRATFPVMQARFIQAENDRYEANSDVLLDNVWRPDSFLSFEDVELLHVMMTISKQNLSDGTGVYHGKTYFFTALSFVQEQLKTRGTSLSKTLIANRLNRLAAIGLIRKLSENSTTKNYFKRTRSLESIRVKTKRAPFIKNTMTLYQIETFQEVFKVAEKRARRLDDKHIRIDQISKASIAYCFGLTWANQVFPVEGKKKVSKYVDEIRAYKQAFYWLLKKQGYVLKEQVEGYAHPRLANRLWTEIAFRTIGTSKRLSQLLKETLQVTGTGAIFLSPRVFHALRDLVRSLQEKGEISAYDEKIQALLARFHDYGDDSTLNWLRYQRLQLGSTAV